MENIKGYITIGPKDNHIFRIAVCYEPTDKQIRNLQEFFGWDFVKADEED